MADNLIGNMFGVDPNQLAQQRYDAQRQAALQYAQLDPFQRANMGMYQAGGNIVGAGAGMMGIKAPGQAEAESRQNIMGSIDTSTPDGLLKGAQIALQQGNPRLASELNRAAQVLASERSKMQYEAAKTAREEAMAEKLARGEEGKVYTEEVGVPGQPGMVVKVERQRDGTWKQIGAPYRKGSGGEGAGGMKPADELKYMTAHGKDYDEAKSVIGTAKLVFPKIESVVNDPKFGYLFGGYTEKALSKFAPGEIAGIQSNIDSLKSNLMTAGLNAMRKTGGVGAITEKEWPIFEKLVASLDPKMDEKTARKRFSEIKTYFDKTVEDASDSYQKKWSRKPDYYDPSIVEVAKEAKQQTSKPAPSTQGRKVIKFGDLP